MRPDLSGVAAAATDGAATARPSTAGGAERLRSPSVRSSSAARRRGRLELREHPVDGDDRALGGDDPENSGARRLDLDRRLVGLDLDDELTRGHRVAVLHEPAAHLRLLHRDGELRHEHRGHATRRSTAATTSSAVG